MYVFDWFTRGTAVPDIYARSGDAEFIIDSDFADDRACDLDAVVWRECQVPVAVFGLQSTLAKHLALVRGQSAADAEQRLSVIREWAARRGGVQAALRESPLLLTIRDGTVTFEDGWHRLGLAAFETGMPEVTALCAWLPDQLGPQA